MLFPITCSLVLLGLQGTIASPDPSPPTTLVTVVVRTEIWTNHVVVATIPVPRPKKDGTRIPI